MNINHVLIRTKNLKQMTRFLTSVTALKEGYRPPFPFPGVWMYGDDKPLIHLAESNREDDAQAKYLDSNEFHGIGAVDHVALDGGNYDELMTRLKKHQISFTERTVPLTFEHQVFVLGPEGIKLEMIFAQDKSSIAH